MWGVIGIALGGLVIQFGAKRISCDQVIKRTGSDINHEIELVRQRAATGDHYPQGVDFVISQMQYARDNGKILQLYEKKTWPKWTWYVSVI